MVKQKGFPAREDGLDIKHLEQDLNGFKVLVGKLMVLALVEDKSFTQEFYVVSSVETRTRDRPEEGQVGDEVSVSELLVFNLTDFSRVVADRNW